MIEHFTRRISEFVHALTLCPFLYLLPNQLNYSGFLSYLIAGIVFWDKTNLSGGFYHLVPHQGNMMFARLLSVIVMRLNSRKEFLNSKMHIAELWIFENSLVFYSEEKDIQFYCNSRPSFTIMRRNGCERMDGWMDG